ncbi:MAG TPA: FHA domain-containing protein [Caulobacteraceae bacterium]|jgi:hypothetical protein|nr:FHA domain-containing protein [Caulobacteraceae bacterium]
METDPSQRAPGIRAAAAVLALLAIGLSAPAALAVRSSASAAVRAHISAAAAAMAETRRHDAVRQDDEPASAARRQHDSGCARLDAENSPACADSRPRDPESLNAPEQTPPAPATSGGAAGASGVAGAATASAAPPQSHAAAPAARPKPISAEAPTPRSILTRYFWPIVGAAAVLAVAGGGVIGALAIGARAGGRRATRPTPYRRDLILSDRDGRGWRIPGQALSPGVCVGSDPRGLGYVNGDQVDKRHVEFWVRDGRLLVRRRSTRPTFLNDRNLPETEHCIVSTGDRMRLGDSEFTLLIE